MNTKLKVAGLMLVAGGLFMSQAQARDSVVGAVIGAGAGAIIGGAIGGHDGAIIGGVIGAATGAAAVGPRHSVGGQYSGPGYVQTHGRPHDARVYSGVYGAPAVTYYPAAPVVVTPPRGYYQAPAPVVVAPAPRFYRPQPYYRCDHPNDARYGHHPHHRHDPHFRHPGGRGF